MALNTPAWGADINLNPNTKEINLLENSILYVDWEKNKNLYDVLEIFERKRQRDAFFKDGSVSYSSTSYWFNVTISNNSNQENWILDFGTSMFDGLQRYDQLFVMSLQDDGTPLRLNDNDLADKRFLNLTVPAGETTTYVIFVKPDSGFFFQGDIKIMDPAHYIALQEAGANLYNFLFIIFAFLVGATIASFLFTKNTPFLMLVPYLCGIFLLFSYHAGQIILPLDSEVLNHAALITVFLSTAMMCARSFIPKQKALRIYDFFFNIMFGLLICYIIGLSFATNLAFFAVTIFSFMPAFIFLGLSIISFVSFSMHKITSVYYMLAWLTGLIGITLSKFVETNIINTVNLDDQSVLLLTNAIWIGLALNIAFLALALVDAMYMARREAAEEIDAKRRRAEEQQEIRQAKEAADQAQLVRIIQREKDLMEELRVREQDRAEALRLAKEMADEANSAKSAFLAVISHEIRTPMTGIMGMVRLLKGSELAHDQREYADTIEQSGESLLSLLNDILDFSKIESGKMDIEVIDFDIRKLIHSVKLLMIGKADEKNLEIIENVDDNVPTALKGDPTRLRQILLNLVGNAIKFTDEGSVKITVQVTKRMPEKNKLSIYFGVEDTGIGISDEAREKLFNPFAQADQSISRRFGGTGLGLAICKKLVEAMQGEIDVHSREGDGSTFFYNLPMEPGDVDAIEEQSASLVDLPPLHVLIVDDNDVNLRVVSGILNNNKHTSSTALNGEEAIEKLTNNNFDLILMDMEMPVMDGVTATAKIRDMDNPEKASIPIIAMTANVINEDIERCRQAGMNDYTSKPINPEKMFQTIADVMHGKERFADDFQARKQGYEGNSEAITADSPTTTTPSYHDDSWDDPLAPDMGALYGAAPQAQPTKPQQQGSNEAMDTTPKESTVSKEDDHLVDLQTLETDYEEDLLVHASLDDERYEQTASKVKAEQEKLEAAQQAGKEETIFNTELLEDLKMSLGSDELYELTKDVVEKSASIIEEIKAFHASGDIQAMGHKGHDLKGMTGNFGLAELSRLAKIIEDAGKNNNLQGVDEAIAKMPGALERADEAMKNWVQK